MQGRPCRRKLHRCFLSRRCRGSGWTAVAWRPPAPMPRPRQHTAGYAARRGGSGSAAARQLDDLVEERTGLEGEVVVLPVADAGEVHRSPRAIRVRRAQENLPEPVGRPRRRGVGDRELGRPGQVETRPAPAGQNTSKPSAWPSRKRSATPRTCRRAVGKRRREARDVLVLYALRNIADGYAGRMADRHTQRHRPVPDTVVSTAPRTLRTGPHRNSDTSTSASRCPPAPRARTAPDTASSSAPRG